ncbi:MAG: F0F1 ATP synthase subunit A [Chloroflexi bacterium]|nr:F0F1 ATP synthase subunit A [Chloroflexota bacterium]
MSRLGRTTKLLILVGAVVAILFLVGLIAGAIGQNLNISTPSILHGTVIEINSSFFFRGEPVAKIGSFNITNTFIASWITIIVVVVFAFAATRKMKIIPGRLQALVETGVETLLNFVESVAGKKQGRIVFPVIATIFVMVMFNAYLALFPIYGPGIHVTEKAEVFAVAPGIVQEVRAESDTKVEKDQVVFVLDTGEEIKAETTGEIRYANVEVGTPVAADANIAEIESKAPLLRSASTDINLTLSLALIAVFFIEFWGLRAKGFRVFITEYVNFGTLFSGIKMLFKGKFGEAVMTIVTGVINAVMGVLEAISHGTRAISFAFRLFGNMTAGEVLLMSATFLIPFMMAIPFYGLELLIGFIQALIFGGLTLVFASIAVAHGSEEHEAHE